VDHISISQKVTENFEKCSISNVVDGTNDDLSSYDSEEDGDVRSECEEDQGSDCEDEDSDTDWLRYTEFDIMCMK
jgi:hypothetical protein